MSKPPTKYPVTFGKRKNLATLPNKSPVTSRIPAVQATLVYSSSEPYFLYPLTRSIGKVKAIPVLGLSTTAHDFVD
ncbi:MAG: hypothetical protein MZU97_17440 [Bacillus subtilis]|nr:hypothetical protein [Bacillus subtilis]